MSVKVARKGRFWGMAEVNVGVRCVLSVCEDVLVTCDGKDVSCDCNVCASEGFVVRVVCVRCVWSEECENVCRRDVVRVGVDVCEMSCWVVCLWWCV